MTWQGVLRNIAEAEGSIIVEPAMVPEGVMIGIATAPKICHPKGKDRGRCFPSDLGQVIISGTSLNRRPVFRLKDAGGVLQTYRIRHRKSVKMNRLPRNSKRRTGVWNGQNAADMVTR